MSRRPAVYAMRAIAVVLGMLSAFFAYYTARLLIVTHLFQLTRAGGGGRYIGAVVFPILTLTLGWASRRLWRRATATRSPVQ